MRPGPEFVRRRAEPEPGLRCTRSSNRLPATADRGIHGMSPAEGPSVLAPASPPPDPVPAARRVRRRVGERACREFRRAVRHAPGRSAVPADTVRAGPPRLVPQRRLRRRRLGVRPARAVRRRALRAAGSRTGQGRRPLAPGRVPVAGRHRRPRHHGRADGARSGPGRHRRRGRALAAARPDLVHPGQRPHLETRFDRADGPHGDRPRGRAAHRRVPGAGARPQLLRPQPPARRPARDRRTPGPGAAAAPEGRPRTGR